MEELTFWEQVQQLTAPEAIVAAAIIIGFCILIK